MNKVIIIQHNVLHSETRKHNLINTYLDINPHIILINGHGMKQKEHIKVPGFITYQLSSSDELHDGCTLLIRSHIKHKLDNNYITDFKDISFETEIGDINIATTSLPPRRPYLPFPNSHKIFHENNPSYLLANMNASSTQLGNNHNNQVGKHLNDS